MILSHILSFFYSRKELETKSKVSTNGLAFEVKDQFHRNFQISSKQLKFEDFNW